MPTQVEQIARQIEALLLAGNARDDARLPAERALAERFGVSRATVREAIASLVSRGLLVRRRGDGTYPVSPAERGMAEIWGEMVQQHPMLQGDLVEFRVMLERQTAQLAALRHDARDRERLQATFAAVDAAYAGNNRMRQIRSDVAFHRAIAEATHNPVFSYLMSSLLKLLHEHVQLSLAGIEPHSDTAQHLRRQHAALLDAILARDAPRARQCAGEHMDFVAVKLNALGRRDVANGEAARR